jgi:hypothetical protein
LALISLSVLRRLLVQRLLVREGADEVRWAFSRIVEEELSLARFNDELVLSVAIRRGHL